MTTWAHSSLDPIALRPRQTHEWRRGLALALVAHALLVLALALSVQWSMHDERPIEAEVWSEMPQISAPPLPPSCRGRARAACCE